MLAEQVGRAGVRRDGRRSTSPRPLQSGGNMEGKETRFGIANSALWATATTAASNGSVNSMHDSYTPLGGLVPMWLMQLGEIIFGGVGSGLYGMLMFVIVAVFVAGLMVGRTPEYLGKKIEALRNEDGVAGDSDSAAGGARRHGDRRVGPGLEYTAGEEVKSNLEQSRRPRLLGSALRVLVGRQQQRQRVRRPDGQRAVLQHRAWELAMFASRYWLMIPTLAIAGSLGAQEIHAAGRRHVADASAAVRGDAGEHDPAGRCADVRSGTGPGARRRTFADDSA